MKSKPRLLIFYPDSSTGGGHHSFFLKHILESTKTLFDTTCIDKTDSIPHFENTIEWCLSYTAEKKYDVVFLPYFDRYVKELWTLRNLKLQTKLVCLWLDPLCFKTFQIKGFVKRLKEELRKQFIIRSSLAKNFKILTVDIFAYKNLKKYFPLSGWIVDTFLPEPPLGFKKSKKYEFDFLLYGSLSRRKGIHTLINALYHLRSLNKKVTVKILGNIGNGVLSPTENRRFLELIDEGFIDHTNKWVEYKEIVKNISYCNVILLPYEDFYASSGILSSACSFGKRILASDIGTVGALIKKYDIGYTFSAGNTLDLADSMINILSTRNKSKQLRIYNDKYLTNHKERFKSKISYSLSSCLNEHNVYYQVNK